MGQLLAQNEEIEDLGELSLGAPVEVEELEEVELGEAVEVEAPAEIEEIQEEELGAPVELLPQLLGGEEEKEKGAYDFRGLMAEPAFLTPDQQNWIDDQKQYGRESFEAASNRLTMKMFEKAMKYADIPHSVMKAAVLAKMQGASVPEMVEIATQQATDWDKVRAPEYSELIFEAAVNSGMNPSFAATSAKGSGVPMDLVGSSVIDPFNLISPLSKIKPAKKLIGAAKRIALGKPIEWSKDVVKKFITAGVELRPDQFDNYLRRFKEIESMKEVDLHDISKNIGVAYDDLQDLTFDKAAAARELLTEADGGIQSDALIDALQAAVDEKIGTIHGEGSEAAVEAYKRMKRNIEGTAERIAREGTVLEQIHGFKPIEEYDELGNLIPTAPISAELPMIEVKRMIAQMDADIRTTSKLLTKQDDKTAFIIKVRQNIDELLKGANPEYRKEMIPVAAEMKKLAFIRDRLGASKNFGVSDKLSGQTLKGIATNPKAKPRQVSALEAIDEASGSNFLDDVNDRYMFDLMNQTSTRGASKAVAGGGAGAMVGGLISLALPTDPVTKLLITGTLTGAGTIAGKMMDTYGRPAVRSMMLHLVNNREFSKRYGASIVSTLPGANMASKISSNVLIKHFKPGIVRAFVSRYADGDHQKFTDDGEIKITDYDSIREIQASIKLDRTMSTVQKYQLISGLNAEFIEHGEINIKLDDKKTSKVLKGKKIPEDFFKKGKK